jgi:copper chaperone
LAEITINIEGMSCRHCVMRVKKALDALPGIKNSDVDIGKSVVSYDESIIQKQDIENAVIKAGYKIKN